MRFECTTQHEVDGLQATLRACRPQLPRRLCWLRSIPGSSSQRPERRSAQRSRHAPDVAGSDREHKVLLIDAPRPAVHRLADVTDGLTSADPRSIADESVWCWLLDELA